MWIMRPFGAQLAKWASPRIHSNKLIFQRMWVPYQDTRTAQTRMSLMTLRIRRSRKILTKCHTHCKRTLKATSLTDAAKGGLTTRTSLEIKRWSPQRPQQQQPPHTCKRFMWDHKWALLKGSCEQNLKHVDPIFGEGGFSYCADPMIVLCWW